MRSKNLFLTPAWARTSRGLVLIGVSLGLILFNILFPQPAAVLRSRLVDLLAPVIHVAAKPAELLASAGGSWGELVRLREENAQLHDEITKLKAWAEAARQYEQENRGLKGLLKYKDESVLSFITARVIGESSGAFSNSAIVTAGTRDGVEADMVALDENGVVGRVIEPGDWSARILLLQDPNFRLPVTIEEANQHAILAGQGRADPQLLFVTQEAEIKPGMRVVTSGQGGIFPSNLPVGVVKDIQDHQITLQPFGRTDRLDMIRLARYQLNTAPAPVSPNPAPRP
ncbi:MAG TPA: rod shape-determining protein MreC [Alphaproteobacteria bacterium]|nr:rod shape-determining protein MreC [Alphaproteobacteria bacterium]